MRNQKGGEIMKKVLPFLIFLCFLILFFGCEKKEKKAHLTATIDSYEYNPLNGKLNLYIKVVNDGDRRISYYEVWYRVSYDSKHKDDWTWGSSFYPGKTETKYDETYIGSAETINSVTVIEVELEI